MKSNVGASSGRVSDGVRDVDFDAAEDVSSIEVRLHPLDVGYEVKRSGMVVRIDETPTLRVSYAARNGDRRVMEGPLDAVVGRLRKLGYKILVGSAES